MLKFVSSNRHKYEEYHQLVDLEWVPLEFNERATTLRGVVLEKLAQAVDAKVEPPFFVEDTAFFIEGRFPGVYAGRVLKEYGLDWTRAFVGRPAMFRCIIGLWDGQGVLMFEGEVKGSVVEPRGKGGFGYDSIFLPEGHSKTFAEDPEHKRKVSHRMRAFKKMLEHFNNSSQISS